MNRKNDDEIACLSAELFNSIHPTPAVQMLIFGRLERLQVTQSNGMDSSSPNRHLSAKLVSDTTSKRKRGVHHEA